MQSSVKGEAKKNLARAGRVVRKEKKSTQAKDTEKRQLNTHDSMENECPNCGKDGHKASGCCYTQTNKSQGKGKGTRKSKSKVTEISESDSSKQVDDWCPRPKTSPHQPQLSQVNTIGCADEGLWIFSTEDSKKRRYTVNWRDQSCSTLIEKWKTDEHELIIDSGCFAHVSPPWFAPQFPMVSSTNVVVWQRTTWQCNTTDKK